MATSGSNYSNYPAKNLLDTKESTFAQTNGGKDYQNQWFEIDLGAEKLIQSIEIKNRLDCCQTRIAGSRIRIKNSAGADVYTGPTITAEESDKLSFIFDKLT